MNILPEMIYDYLDEDPLVPTSQQLQLADSTMVQPYGIAENVLIEFQDSLTIDKMRGMIDSTMVQPY
jgi:hypothetical protein